MELCMLQIEVEIVSVQDKKRKEGLPTETEKGFHGKLPDMTKKPL